MTCAHCGRHIVLVDGVWVDPEATGDDAVWRETCDANGTFTAEHEPRPTSIYDDARWMNEAAGLNEMYTGFDHGFELDGGF